MKDEVCPNEYFRNLWENLLKTEQNNICGLIESVDSNKFREEVWIRKDAKKEKNLGGGITRILENGNVFEKCAVNYSCVYGSIDREAAKQMCVNQYNKEYINTTKICHSDDINSIITKVMNSNNIRNINEKYKYYASGISIIAHPVNPNVPSIHSNFRFFQIFIKTGKKKKKNFNSSSHRDSNKNGNINNISNGNTNKNNYVKSKIDSNYKSLKHWFGGGCDLSPCYIFPELFINFHHSFKLVCDKYNHLFYKYFKIWCDLYFRIKHRNINRGIGGIFFDNLLDNNIKTGKITKTGRFIKDHCYNNNSTTCSSTNKKHINGNKDCKCYSCNSIMDKSYRMIYFFIQECIIILRKTYFYILSQTVNCKYDDNMINWQRVCRGRYAEFNLIYDRGTKFGLQLINFKTYRKKKKRENAEDYSSTTYLKDEIFDEQNSDYLSDEHEKIDNVFASLPLKCDFFYKYKIVKYSREYETLQILKHPKKWVEY
ncbi:coproporphyrinogen-III oxidase, putative [Plasmodium malariae]|uniref:coproporphyrinogen oxidase n=1 Tax=Plasmodium malariae TaxID=5858 RepID=A0A1C3KD89_PLAMA|nr:coproporphyrinogen-III oxidase, putative [Plasmodium malariae]